MASSEAEIANLAAIKIGEPARITSLDDDRKVARELKAVWGIERRATLRAGEFNFSIQRAELASVVLGAGETIYPYSAAFELPAGCLRMLEVLDDSLRLYHQVEGGRILADSTGPLRIRYVADVPEPALWDDAFAEAFACRLAWRCGARVAGSVFDTDAAMRDFRMAIGAAKTTDARENPPEEQDESSWIEARLGAGGSGFLPAGILT